MYDLTGFQRDLMYIVTVLEEPSGLAIQEELETYYDKEVFTGRLYPNLDALVDRGLIEKGDTTAGRTTMYSLSKDVKSSRTAESGRRGVSSQYALSDLG